MRKTLLFLMCALLVLPGAALAADPPAAAPAPEAAEAPKPPAFYKVGDTVIEPLPVVEIATGNPIDLAGDLKRTAVICIMQTACANCLTEIETVQSWANENPGKASLMILSVDMLPDKARFEGYSARNNIRGKWFSDPDFKIPRRFQFEVTPSMVVLGADKKVLMLKRGFNVALANELKAELSKVIP